MTRRKFLETASTAGLALPTGTVSDAPGNAQSSAPPAIASLGPLSEWEGQLAFALHPPMRNCYLEKVSATSLEVQNRSYSFDMLVPRGGLAKLRKQA